MPLKKPFLILGASVLVFALAAALLLWRAPLPFRANRVLYLANARRFPEALAEYERLAGQHTREAARLPADFRRDLIERAAAYYSQHFTRRLEADAYRAFLNEVSRRPDLASLARRKRLDFLAQLDPKSSATLVAAREILQREGYDPEACWWAAYNQYNPAFPFTIPVELLRFREAYARAPASRQPERRAFLTALLAVADRNWAEAAAALDDYRRARPNEGALDLIRGLACLKAGHPEAAIQRLLQFRAAQPNNPSALRYLAEAYLVLGDYAWAALALHEIRALAPDQEALVFFDVFGADAEDFLTQACGMLRPGAPHEGDAALGAWLGEMAATAPQRRAADRALTDLAAAPGLRPGERAALLQYFLGHDLRAAAAPLAATPASADTTTTLRAASVRHLLADLTTHNPQLTSHSQLTTHNSQPLLTRAGTHHFKLTLPPGATLIVLRVAGRPAGGAGPIVHVNLPALGAQTFYAGNVPDRPVPLVLALRRPSASERQVEGSVSLINDAPGIALTILEIAAF